MCQFSSKSGKVSDICNPQYAYSENVPNAETRSAIEECESGKELETLDITNFEDYVKSL